ncbi:MAG: PorP/SprF family type IX secretion system membrane protein [Bacteroidota bacterium]
MRNIATILFLISVLIINAQDNQFSQYYSASLYLNPGFNGIYQDVAVHMNHKRQLQSAEVINELTQVSLILPIKPKSKTERSIGGAGLMAFREQSGFQGIYDRSSVFFNYAHNLKFGTLGSYLVSIGGQVGYDLRRLNFSSLNWGSQYNAFFGFDDSRPVPVAEFNAQQDAFIVNGGIMYYFNPDRNYFLFKYSGFVGISATNLNRPNTSFTTTDTGSDPVLLKYNGGIEFKINKLFITPSLLFLYLSRNYQYNAGLNMSYAPDAGRYTGSDTQLLFGAWYRFRDSFIFMGGIRVNQLTVRASYDMNSDLFVPNRDINIAQNSVEISIQYSLTNSNAFKKFSNPLF